MFEHNDLANFIGSKLNQTDGYNLQERIEQKIEQYKQSGVELTEEGAVEEIVADSMFKVFESEQYVHDLFEQHESLGEKIASRLKNFVQELKQLAKNLKSPEARAMAKQEAETMDKLAKMFNDAANMAMAKRFNQTQETQEQKGQEGAQYQLKDSDGNIVELTEQQLEDNKKTVANMDTVVEITGNRFAKGKVENLVNAGAEYFEDIGGRAINKVLGETRLNKDGIRHLISQGLTTRRAAIIEAIKPVLENGEIIQVDNNHKGKGFDGALIAAKIEWNEQPYYMGVVIKQEKGTNTYYMHDAVLVQEKRSNNDVVKQDGIGDLTGSRPATPKNSSVAKILESIAEYNGQNGQNAGTGTLFQMKEEVEQVKDLIAVHNRSIDALIRDIKRGGMAAPSIAVTKVQFNYTNFGNVSILFDKNSIDPQANENNRLYGADAWTPIEPTLERKAEYDPKGIRKVNRWMFAADAYENEFPDGLEQVISDWGNPGPEKLAERLSATESAQEAYVDKNGTTEEKNAALDGELWRVKNVRERTIQWLKSELENIVTASTIEVTNENGEMESKPYTIENIVKEMFKGGKKRSVNADFGKELGNVSAPEYRTLDELKADSNRFNERSTLEWFEVTEQMETEAKELTLKVAQENGMSLRNRTDSTKVNDALIEAAWEREKTAENVKKVLAKNGMTITEETAEKLSNLLKRAAADDVTYMEGKPERGVYTDEWGLVVLPANEERSAEAMRDMDNAGINYVTYDGTDADRLRVMNEEARKRDLVFSLKEYSDSELENWKDSKSIEVYTDRVQGMNFINKALTDRNFRGKLYFGKIDTGLAAAIEEATGLDVEDYNLALHADEVRKITESHGNEASENLRGQSAITVNDLLDIPEVVKHATKITAGEYDGHETIVFVREQGNRTTTVTYMVNKKHDLRVQTMYKSNKKRGLSTAYSVQAEHFTSETDPRYSPSDVNVAQENRNVKNQFSLKEDTGVLASLQGVDKINENMRQQIEDSEDFREVVRKLQKVMNSRGGIQEVQKKYVNSLAGELVEKWTPQGLSRKTLAVRNFKQKVEKVLALKQNLW